MLVYFIFVLSFLMVFCLMDNNGEGVFFVFFDGLSEFVLSMVKFDEVIDVKLDIYYLKVIESNLLVMLVIVKVCYNSDQYGIFGLWMIFVDDKLVNLVNWGLIGIDIQYQFEFFSFGIGVIMEVVLIVNGC